MNKSYILLGMYCFGLCTCFGQNIDSIRGIRWISIDYIHDAENYLPCECADSANYWVSVFVASKFTADNNDESDKKIPEVNFNRILQSEPSQFYIISETATKYVISEDNKKFYDLILQNDTLLLIDSIECHKFVKQLNSQNSDGVNNVVLLNKALSLRGYPPIQTILKANLLELSCALSWGNINLVSSLTKRNLCWVLEIYDGFLHIYKVTNPERDPLDPVLKKEIKRLKWVTNGKEKQPHREEYPVFVSPK